MQNNLGKKKKIGYGAGSFLEAGYYNFMTTFLLIYLTSVAMLSPALAGVVSSVAVLMEAVAGIVAGYVSDQFYSKYGRRRPFMITAGMVLAVICCCLFIRIDGSEIFRFWYYFIGATVFWAAYSTFYIPYIALGAEMTSGYDERITLRAYARFFAIAGNLLCTVGPLMVIGKLTESGVEEENAWFIFVVLMCLFCTASACISWTATKGTEPVYKEKQNKPQVEKRIWYIFKDYYQLLRLKTCMILVLSRTCFLIAYTLYTASLVYFMKYKLQLSDASTSTIFLIGIVASFIYMPIIARLAMRLGKQQQIMLALLIAGIGGLYLYSTGVHTVGIVFVYICLFTFAHSSFWQIFNSMSYDITEVDEFVHGNRREGSITSLTSVLGTIAVSVSLWVVGVLLNFSGYDALLGIQGAATITMIERMFVLIPSVMLLISCVILIFYPMNRERFYALQKGIQRKKKNENYEDLLPLIRKLL